MQPYTGPDAPAAPLPATNEDFLKTLIPTYLSMDVDGRVMRMDSFSKVIAPGTRVGWITASEQIIERFVRHNECSNQNPSGISQLVLYKILDESWGHDGYLQWLINLRLQYTNRRDVCLLTFLPLAFPNRVIKGAIRTDKKKDYLSRLREISSNGGSDLEPADGGHVPLAQSRLAQTSPRIYKEHY